MSAATAAAVALCVAAAWLLVRPTTRPRTCRPAHGPSSPRPAPPRGTREPAAVRVALAAAEVAALLRAGAPATAAWSPQLRPGPGDALDRVLADAARAGARGEDPALVLRRAGRPADAAPALDALALAWRTSEVTGAPAAGVLDRLVTSLTADAAAADARDAALAGPRATARVLLVLPLLGVLLGSALGADPLQVLLETPAGRWCGAAGLLCALAGWVWTSLLVRSAERAR